jgi:hypothetical protein
MTGGNENHELIEMRNAADDVSDEDFLQDFIDDLDI